MYSEDSEILVSLLDLTTATGTSSQVHDSAVDGPRTDFNQIELYDMHILQVGYDSTKCLARIGAGVTNEAFRLWSLKSLWTLPLNVIMVE